MKRTAKLLVAVFLIFSSTLFAQQAAGEQGEIRRFASDPARGFSSAYYLYVPKGLSPEKLHSFIVIPNNTGTINDDIGVHDADVKRKIERTGPFLYAAGIAAPVLTPVFPRPATEHNIYTHSLDRDTFRTEVTQLHRLDLQLAAMIADAQERLAKEGIKTENRVLMQGYSASGMFVNRFVFLHPNLVKAAIVGAPGGWPIAPIAVSGGKKLTFPAGISDLKQVTGKKFDLKAVKNVPLFMILGGVDTNDAVPMGDAYDKRESDIVIELFGKTPVERFPRSELLYKEAGLNAEFKLYPNTPHQMSKEMRDDQIVFLKKHAL